jgi:hypothetical protein
MAINFPNSPSNGDAHAGFIYNSTKGVWEASAASVPMSDNPPANPAQGDLWFDSSVAKTYIYYNDGSSSQWVQLNPSGGSDGADATGGGESPVIYTEPPTSHALSPEGSTSTVQMQAVDPEGTAITYGIAYANSTNARPAQLSADTTIDQNTGTYTFTPSSTAGTFKARLSASDGVQTSTRFVNFDLSFTFELLLIAGGGGGNDAAGGGGGAGGLVLNTNYSFASGTTYNIVVGTGGAASTAQDARGTAGSDSTFTAGSTLVYTATGGGGGGPYPATGSGDGGSGAGGGRATSGDEGASTQASYSGLGFGNAGGSPLSNGGAGGGGGAGGVGGNATASNGGAGGAGKAVSITGSSVNYAPGGPGGGYNVSKGSYTTGSGSSYGAGGEGGIYGAANPTAGAAGVCIIASTATPTSVTGTYTLDTSSRAGYNVYTFTGNGSITF